MGNKCLRNIIKKSSASIIAVNIDYNDYDLDYDLMEETIQHIIGKCFMSTMCILAYFEDGYNKTIFVSPQISPENVKVISKYINEINNILVNNNISHSIELITNEDFNVRIFQPVLSKLIANNVINESILENDEEENQLEEVSYDHKEIEFIQ